MQEVQTRDGVVVHGRCLPQTSINKAPYRVETLLDVGRKLKSAHCNCVSGITGLCKHTSALVCYVNAERTESCTDSLQQWQKPSQKRQTLYPKGETIETLFNLDPVTPPSFIPEAGKLDTFLNLLKESNETSGMLFKALTASPKPVKASQPQFEYPPEFFQKTFFSAHPTYDSKCAVKNDLKISFQSVFVTLPSSQQDFFRRNVQLSSEGCKNVFLTTVGQTENPNWFLQRKNRISASKAHKIVRAKKKETRLKYFFENPPATANMLYGQHLESKARDAFQLRNQCEVLPSGLIVKPSQSWLCASPDGITADDHLCLEIKCPSSCKGKAIEVDYISNGTLSPSHPYFTQVQLQMYVSNTTKCNFFVYSEIDCKEMTVLRDDAFL